MFKLILVCSDLEPNSMWISPRNFLRWLVLWAPDHVCCRMTPCFSADEGGEPVMCAHMHGSGWGTAPDRIDAVLFQAVQGPGPPCTCCEHYLWVQGQCGHLSSGKVSAARITGTCSRDLTCSQTDISTQLCVCFATSELWIFYFPHSHSVLRTMRALFRQKFYSCWSKGIFGEK